MCIRDRTHVIHTSKAENQWLNMKRRKEPTEFKLGTIVVPYIEMFDEAVAIRTEGVQLIIDTYFNDLSSDCLLYTSPGRSCSDKSTARYGSTSR